MTEYNPEKLFDLSKDHLTYKDHDFVHNISYNNDNQAIQLNMESSIPYLYFPELKRFSFIKHGFSTRLGGVSKGDFTSLNLSFSRGDEVEHVKTNYKRLVRAMDLDDTSLVFSDQIHDSKIHLVTQGDPSITDCYEKHLTGIDGLITNVVGVTLVTSYADCVPLYFVDPVHKAIGLSHSGWKGTVKKIGKKTVEAMQMSFGTNPEDLVCAIGPSICFDCYEISEDVANEFRKVFSNKIIEKILYRKSNQKYHLDLWRTNKEILLEAGVKAEHIVNSNLCTCCNPKLLFSHRASSGKRGNLAAFLSLSVKLEE